MIEVELKFAIPAATQSLLRERLADLLSTYQREESMQIDRYYDTTDFSLLRQAVFARVRNQRWLEVKYHKQADPLHQHCIERSFPLAASPAELAALHLLCAQFLPEWCWSDTVEGMLLSNHLVVFAPIQKQRTRYISHNLIVCLDHVIGLGDFLEVETNCNSAAEIQQAQSYLQTFVTRLAFPMLRPVNTGYVELWLQTYHSHISLPELHQREAIYGNEPVTL